MKDDEEVIEPDRTVQTWRVPVEDGDIKYVETDGTRAWKKGRPRDYVVSDDTHREAVTLYAAHARWAVKEILAPGEVTREEAISEALQAFHLSQRRKGRGDG